MALVIGDLLLLIVIVALIGTAVYAFSRKKDTDEIRTEKARLIEEWRAAEREAKRYVAGVPLICLNCEARFLGPLTDTGCPVCHMSGLVITVDEFSRSAEAQMDLRSKLD